MINKSSPEKVFLYELSSISHPTREDYFKLQRKVARELKVQFFNKDNLIKEYHNLIENNIIKGNIEIENLLRLKSTRSASGIVVISILTKPYGCPGKCLYCPDQKGIPKSYLSDEPAVMRAVACKFDPEKQIASRLKALTSTGHNTSKINIRIIGETWSYYSKNYQMSFIKKCYKACNNFDVKDKPVNNHTLYELQQFNTNSKNRIVEISIETRQDYINEQEIKRLRKFGVTKVELGVQSIYDDVLKLNNRGHNNSVTISATKMLKDAGLKISYQIMPNLPGSNLTTDKKMFHQLFTDQNYQPDYLKIYPLALLKETGVYKLYKQKKYKPYDYLTLKDLLKAAKKEVPYYTRIERIIRDIPANHIVEGGAKISNLRQIVSKELVEENFLCKCIRCREIGSKDYDKSEPSLFRQDYDSSDGKEIFLSYENKDRTKLYSMLRLRIPSYYFSGEKHFINILNKSAIIREIHTYGQQLNISTQQKDASQHKGLGKKLMEKAEKIAKKEFELSKITVISGVGVRDYFKKLGYELDESYMVKNI